MKIEKQMIVLGLFRSGRYSVDLENGRVISHIGKEPRVIKPLVLPTGYEQIGFDLGYGVRFSAYTHQVVYLFRYGTYNPEYTIDHIDRNNGNNSIHNLRCVSYKTNVANSDNPRNSNKPFKPRKTEQEKEEMVQKWKEGHSVSSIAKDYKCGRQNVYVILTNRGCNIGGKKKRDYLSV